MIEEWRDIPGFEGLYQISNHGRIKSLSWVQKHSSGKFFTKRVRVRKFNPPATNRYHTVLLATPAGPASYQMHRLIASAFIPNTQNKPFINHINGKKNDNRIENLEWCTRSENTIHSFATGLQSNKGENHPQAILTDDDVREIRSRYANGESSWKIFKSLNMSYTNVKDIIARRTWAHIW